MQGSSEQIICRKHASNVPDRSLKQIHRSLACLKVDRRDEFQYLIYDFWNIHDGCRPQSLNSSGSPSVSSHVSAHSVFVIQLVEVYLELLYEFQTGISSSFGNAF
jgi:hypothetical protein